MPAFTILLSVLALACRFRLLFPSDTRLLVMFTLANFGHNAGFGARSLESSQSTVQRFIFFYTNFRHFVSLPLPTGRGLQNRYVLQQMKLYTFSPGMSSAQRKNPSFPVIPTTLALKNHQVEQETFLFSPKGGRQRPPIQSMVLTSFLWTHRRRLPWRP